TLQAPEFPERCTPLRADQCLRKGLEPAPAVLCRRRKSMSRPCKVCAQVNQKFLRYLERTGSLQFQAHGPCNRPDVFADGWRCNGPLVKYPKATRHGSLPECWRIDRRCLQRSYQQCDHYSELLLR